MKPGEINLDDIWLSKIAQIGYDEFAFKCAHILKVKKINIDQIPDEKVRVEENGTLIIFIEIDGSVLIEFEVPASEWGYNESFVN